MQHSSNLKCLCKIFEFPQSRPAVCIKLCKHALFSISQMFKIKGMGGRVDFPSIEKKEKTLSNLFCSFCQCIQICNHSDNFPED